MRSVTMFIALVALLYTVCTASALPLGPEFNQGFEDNIDGWFTPTRVASGTNGITAADGSWYATVTGGEFTRWGGYADEWPTGGWTTSIDIYLDMDYAAQQANHDTRMAWSSAANGTDSTHQRDFIFNVGTIWKDAADYYYAISWDNGGFWPDNPGKDPLHLTTGGWYTLQHRFYDNGGLLGVDMSVLDPVGTELKLWTLPSNAEDTVPAEVGANRYGWFVNSGFPSLAIDNSYRSGPASTDESPEPATWLLLACTGVAAAIRRKRSA